MHEADTAATSTAYFDQARLWGRPLEPYQAGVRDDLLRLIGSRPASVLDVGCGDGVITDALPASMHVVGLDSSHAALAHVRRPTVCGSATQLPFPDGHFDLVMANDLLEHLPDEALEQAIHEMKRVARRWLVVTVPFMECLDSARTRCGACGCRYHLNHHQRAFGVPEIAALLGDLAPSVLVFSGAAVDRVEAVQRALRAHFGVLTQWDLAVCPECGAQASQGSPPELGRFVDALAQEAAPLVGWRYSDRSECIAVFALDDTALTPLPAEAGGISAVCLDRAGCAFATLPARLEIQDGKRMLCLSKAPNADAALYLRQTAGGINFLYRVPVADPPQCLRAPRWFQARDLLAPAPNSTDAMACLLPFISATLGHRLGTSAEHNLRAELASLQREVGRIEQLRVDLQNLRAENDALKLAQGRRDQLEVDLQNALGENEALRAAAVWHEQLTVDLQNSRAENDALRADVGRLGHVTVDLQNARAQQDALKVAAAQRDQLAVDLQNLRAENDVLKTALGRHEQLAVDLQNIRAENDALKLTAGRCEQLAIQLQNLHAENDALKHSYQRGDAVSVGTQYPPTPSDAPPAKGGEEPLAAPASADPDEGSRP